MQSRIQELYCLMPSIRDLDKILTIKSLTKNCSQGKKSHHQFRSLTGMSNNYRNMKEKLYQLKELNRYTRKECNNLYKTIRASIPLKGKETIAAHCLHCVLFLHYLSPVGIIGVSREMN